MRAAICLAAAMALAGAGACLGRKGDRPSPSATLMSIRESPLGDGDSATECMLQSPLTSAGVAANAQLVDLLEADAFTRALMSYLIRCALPAGARVEVTAGEESLAYDGSLGLAPEWADGPCDEACQEWVSACIFAHQNFYPIHVGIFFGGPQTESGLDARPPEDYRPMEEGAFYGNFFIEPPRLYACRGSGVDPFYRAFRLCTQPGSSCGIQVVGTCGDFDGATGLPSDRPACESFNEQGAYYERCHNVAASPDGVFPADSHVYTRVVTVHLPESHFMGDDAACFDAP